MKKSSLSDFSQPTRQSYAAIVLIMYKLYKVLLRQLFPLLVIILIQGTFSKANMFLYVIIVAAVIASAYSILAFFKYYFYIKGDKLIVKKGVFKKSTIEIPFDRIQSINFEQNLLHRVFNVVKINMDTAGSSKNELELNALNHQRATALSEVILGANKRQADSFSPHAVSTLEKEVIFRLNVFKLIKVGLTVNHLRSVGIILFFFLWLFDNLREVGLDMYERVEDYLPMAEALSRSFLVVIFFVLLLSLISLIISMTRVVLRFYDLKMYRKDNGFVVESGLLNRKEYAAKDAKIQLVSWSQNILQKLAGIFSISLKQASSIEVKNKKALQVVGLDKKDIERTQQYVFRKDHDELSDIQYEGVNTYYLLRRLGYWTAVMLLALFVIWTIGKDSLLLYVLLFYTYGVLSFYLSFRKKKFGFGDKLMCLKGGIYGHASVIMQLYKIQGIKILSTPFQRRRKLCSLRMFTASGSILIPDIEKLRALEIKNMLLFKVERSRKKWM